MKITKYSHACVRIERDGAVLVIDPGTFSEPEALDGVDAVLITHEHFDHLDVDKLADALARRPAVTVHTHPDVVPKLEAMAEVVHPVRSGEEFSAAGFSVRAYGGLHAVIHPDIPPVANLGFLVEESIYHPGDSFDVPVGAAGGHAVRPGLRSVAEALRVGGLRPSGRSSAGVRAPRPPAVPRRRRRLRRWDATPGGVRVHSDWLRDLPWTPLHDVDEELSLFDRVVLGVVSVTAARS